MIRFLANCSLATVLAIGIALLVGLGLPDRGSNEAANVILGLACFAGFLALLALGLIGCVRLLRPRRPRPEPGVEPISPEIEEGRNRPGLLASMLRQAVISTGGGVLSMIALHALGLDNPTAAAGGTGVTVAISLLGASLNKHE